jgi:hypothetical protein
MASVASCNQQEQVEMSRDKEEMLEQKSELLRPDEIKVEDDSTLSDTFLHKWADEDVKPLFKLEPDWNSNDQNASQISGASAMEGREQAISRFNDTFTKSNDECHKAADVMRDVLAKAPLSHILKNSCLFECPKCGGKFTSLPSIKSHFSKTSHENPKFQSYSKRVLKKAIAYKCQVCKERVLCDVSFMRTHIYLYHRMSMNDYKAKFESQIDFSVLTLKKVTQKVLQEGELSEKLLYCIVFQL